MKRKALIFAIAILFSCFSFPALAQNKLPPREITVNIAVDQFYVKDNPKWREDIEKVIEKTNQVYGALPKPILFKIKEIKLWDSTTNLMDAMIIQLEMLQFNEKAQITLGFTGQEAECTNESNGLKESCIGIANFLGNHAIISKNKGRNWPQHLKYFTPEEQASTVIHEIGHIFGAEHMNGVNSYMDESGSYAGEHFDEKSIETIMKNRDREF